MNGFDDILWSDLAVAQEDRTFQDSVVEDFVEVV